MQSKTNDNNDFAQSYEAAKHNLINNLDSLGRAQTCLKRYESCQHPLEQIISDLVIARTIVLDIKKTNDAALIPLKESTMAEIHSLRKIIKEAITTLSVDELLKVSFDSQSEKRTSLLVYLGGLVEIELYKETFVKLKDNIDKKELLYSFSLLEQSFNINIPESLRFEVCVQSEGFSISTKEWRLSSVRGDEGLEMVFQILDENDFPQYMQLGSTLFRLDKTIEKSSSEESKGCSLM